MLLGLPLLGTSVTCENKYAVKIDQLVSIEKKNHQKLAVACRL